MSDCEVQALSAEDFVFVRAAEGSVGAPAGRDGVLASTAVEPSITLEKSRIKSSPLLPDAVLAAGLASMGFATALLLMIDFIAHLCRWSNL